MIRSALPLVRFLGNDFNPAGRTQDRRAIAGSSMGGLTIYLAGFTGGRIRENVYPTRASKPLPAGVLSQRALQMQAYKAHEIIVSKATSGWQEVSDWRLINQRQFQQFHHVDAPLAALALGHKVG